MATCRPTLVGMFCVGKDNICLIEDVTGNSSPHTSHFTLSNSSLKCMRRYHILYPQHNSDFHSGSEVILFCPHPL